MFQTLEIEEKVKESLFFQGAPLNEGDNMQILCTNNLHTG